MPGTRPHRAGLGSGVSRPGQGLHDAGSCSALGPQGSPGLGKPPAGGGSRAALITRRVVFTAGLKGGSENSGPSAACASRKQLLLVCKQTGPGGLPIPYARQATRSIPRATCVWTACHQRSSC